MRTVAAILVLLLAQVPASSADSAAATSQFARFARGWMELLWRVEGDNRESPTVFTSENGQAIRYTGYTQDFETELKPTGDMRFPYVGILRYTERTYTCPRDALDRCLVIRSVPVTELFRYQNGQWVY